MVFFRVLLIFFQAIYKINSKPFRETKREERYRERERESSVGAAYSSCF